MLVENRRRLSGSPATGQGENATHLIFVDVQYDTSSSPLLRFAGRMLSFAFA